jgi:hypothetical protein
MKPHTEPSTQEVLAGLVERITYHNSENGFCVLRAKVRGHRDVVTVVGHAAAIAAGEWITASGNWVNDRTHGQQFKARFLRTSPPSSSDGIEKYLSSGMIRGVGAVYANKLVRAFGDKVFDVIESTLARAFARGRWYRSGSRRQHSRRLGRAERRCVRSWSFCTATVSAPRGRCGSSRPMAPMPSRSCPRTRTGSRAIFVASASRPPTPLRGNGSAGPTGVGRRCRSRAYRHCDRSRRRVVSEMRYGTTVAVTAIGDTVPQRKRHQDLRPRVRDLRGHGARAASSAGLTHATGPKSAIDVDRLGTVGKKKMPRNGDLSLSEGY